ncbi:hypothetical protein EVAR_8155_1 [Eumeta japonica]|uniref:Uncharacterized protein n=1 Tax=Eumeta variegata TaxID=151549 RepID=A0A4C1TSV7_EUMVA|nr:hypothetical protein EVAR_8155_1 [Eumeta japonica]
MLGQAARAGAIAWSAVRHAAVQYLRGSCSKRAPAEAAVTHDNEVLCNDATEVVSALKPQELTNSNQIEQNTGVPQESENSHVEGSLHGAKCESVSELKHALEEQTVRFEKLKDDLSIKQRAVMELYASMRTRHKKLVALGQTFALPPTEELCVMNLARLPPERLLELCTDSDAANVQVKRSGIALSGSFTIDTMKLYNIPMQLLAACEQTLSRRKELTDWLDSFLMSDNEDVDVKTALLKINEFNSDSEILKRTLDNVKENFFKDIYEITDTLRNTVNDATTFRIRAEELTRELSEINTQNATLRKQLHNVDYQKTQYSRSKIDELEKVLREERTKKLVLREKLVRVENHAKIEADRVSNLNTMIEQLKIQRNNLERKLQQLHDQNQAIKSDYDSELDRLTSVIKDNKDRFEEMLADRKTLESEKESLKKSLQELEQNYKESIQNLKNESVLNENKLQEIEDKYSRLMEENTKLSSAKKQLDDQLLEAELRNEKLMKSLKKKNDDIECKKDLLKEIEVLKKDLEVSNKEIEAYKNMIKQKADTITEIEKTNRELHVIETSLKRELNNKNKYISDLEINHSLVKQHLEESSKKLDFYEKQMIAFQNRLKELFQGSGELKDLDEIHKKILDQNLKLQKTVAQNEEVTQHLQSKDSELKRYTNDIATLNNLLKQKDNIIKILSAKQEEEASLIKVLQNNLEMKSHIENEYNRQLYEKNKELTNLSQEVKIRKGRVQELENIVLTLEDQARKLEMQKRNDREKLMSLERKIAEYEVYRAEVKNRVEPQFDMDNLIKILEDELESSFESNIMNSDEHIPMSRKYADRSRREKLESFECHENNVSSPASHKTNEVYPAKIVMGNFIKKTYINPNHDEIFKADKLDRKKAIMNIEVENTEPTTKIFKGSPQNDNTSKEVSPGAQNERKFTQHNVFTIHPSHLQKEKKFKVFKAV